MQSAARRSDEIIDHLIAIDTVRRQRNIEPLPQLIDRGSCADASVVELIEIRKGVAKSGFERFHSANDIGLGNEFRRLSYASLARNEKLPSRTCPSLASAR